MADTQFLSREEAEVFSQGLLFVASADEVDESETAQIREFLTEIGYGELSNDLDLGGFKPLHLAVLESSHQRQVFLKAAVALVLADGRISDAEIGALYECAEVLGMQRQLIQIALRDEFRGVRF